MRSPALRFRHAVGLAVVAFSGMAAAGSLTLRVVDQSAAPADDAVIYATPVAAALPGKAPAPAEIAQSRLAFQPLVTVVQAGGTVSFPNRDTVRHQVYSFSPAKVFELRLYAGLPATPVVFDKPGLVVLGCNIHDRMVAYVMVVDTPWYAKTTTDGTGRIEGLPAGDYRVSVWHPRMPSADAPRPVRIGAGDASLEVVVQLKAAS